MARYLKLLTRRFALLACLFTLLPATALAQSPTGTITGRVTDPSGAAVAGATVTIASPSLQGQRKSLTSENGDYIFTFLQPGPYTVSVDATGFERFTRTVAVAPADRVAVNAALSAARITEQVSVSADAPSFQGTVQAAASLKYDTINLLPTTRSLLSYVGLAPGVHSTGPDGNVSIAGAMSFENLFLINGAVIQDNIRSEPMNLFIEDALQEVTTATSGVNAEYGRFSGGVVTAVTKSGGNVFSGSYRTSLANDNWRTVSPFDEPKADKLIPVYEFTFGGPIVRDRLWFFGAGRSTKNTTADQTATTGIPYERELNEQRYEINSTVSLGSGRRLRVDYLGVNQSGKNSPTAAIGNDVMDLRSLISRKDPMSLVTVNYAGTINRSIAMEAQYSGRAWTIKDAGGLNPDRIEGTPVFDQSTGDSFWAPGFCGICPEKRSNESFFVKGTSFLSSRGGSHDLRFGYDTFNDIRDANNRQSASDFWLYGSATVVDGTNIYPVVDENTLIVHWPLLESSKGTNFRTHALYASDAWAINSRLTANLGLRYDLNRGKNSAGLLISDDKVLSPRLGLSWDPAGNGRTILHASFNRYASALTNSIANESSAAGQPAILVYLYEGPSLNVDPDLPLVPTAEVLKQAFAWYDANLDSAILVQATVPGIETQIRGSLKSPHADEVAFGLSQQIGRRANVRVDFVDRQYKDFYSERTDLATGQVSDEFGQQFDLTLVENTNLLKRRYTGLTMLGSYRPTSRIDVGGSYTLSKLRGNIEGEDVGSGPLAARIAAYPEYSNPAWSDPEGDLSSDQRHRMRIWGNIRVPTGGERNVLSVGVIQRTESGTPYGAAGTISLRDGNLDAYVANPGYVNPPATAVYYFGARDEFRTAWTYRTDVAVNYQRKLTSVTGPELFAQFNFLNVFNQFQPYYNGAGEINTVIRTSVNANLQPFNPFTEDPVKGVNWDYGSRFGQVVDKDAYTLPFTFNMSFGIRF